MLNRVFVALLLGMIWTGCKAPADRLHASDGSVVVGELKSIDGGVVEIGGVAVSVPQSEARVWGRNGASHYGAVTLDSRTLVVRTTGGTVEMPIRSVAAILWAETSVESRVFDVPAEAGWICTHILVSPGDFITVSAGGMVSTEAGGSSPDGTDRFSTSTALAPQAVGGALIMKVGAEGGVIQVGSGWSGNAPAGGEIYLGVNTHLAEGSSSSGRYTAAVTTGPAPGAGMTAVFPAGKPRLSF
ncbi:MAG: hypothetical protein R6V62_01045 [Candidatus Fermentibacteraceae bacterium]